MKYRAWLSLGILILAACSPQTPPPAPDGEKIKKGEGGTVIAGDQNNPDGQLDIDKDKLAQDAIVSVIKVSSPTPPNNVQGGFTALRIRTSGVATRPLPSPPSARINPQETVELPCPTGFRLKIYYPAGTQNASELRMYNTSAGWQQLTPYKVNTDARYVVGCMAANALNPGAENVYTLGIPSTSFDAAGGTSQDVDKQGREIIHRFRTAFRVKYTGGMAPDPTQTYKVQVTGPANWNGGQPATRNFNPMAMNTIEFVVNSEPVSGVYTFTYFDGVKQHQDTFTLDATKVLNRPTEITVGRTDTANRFDVSWIPPQGAPIAQQTVSVFDLMGAAAPLVTVQATPQVTKVTIPNFDANKLYGFCVLAYSADPLAEGAYSSQVNDSRDCALFKANEEG